MNIAYIVTRSDAVGGASIHVRDMAQWMIAQGHQATVLVGGEGPVTDLFRAASIPFRSLKHLSRNVHPLRDVMAYQEVAAALKRLHPDLVSTHTAKAGWLGRLACWRLDIPAIYTPHGWVLGYRLSPLEGWIYHVAERAASHWSAAIVCVSHHERQLAVDKAITSQDRLHVIYNGVPDVVPGRCPDPGGEDWVRFVSIARFEAPKDHETLLRALAKLGSFRNPGCELLLVGDGPGESGARRLVAELGIGNWVRFAGYDADPAQTLAGANGFVLSSHSEGFPRSILEAMRASLPVIASDVGGVREAVDHGVNGFLVPAGDVSALASAMESLVRDSSVRIGMGLAARRTYEARFRFERMAQETGDLYAAVLERSRRTAR